MKKEKSAAKQAVSSAVIKQLKSLIFPVIMLAIILVVIFVIINVKDKEPAAEIIRVNAYEGTTDPIILENDELKFTLDPTDTHFTLEVKSTGKVWYSNPEDADTDTIAGGKKKGELKSTLLLRYVTRSGGGDTYNNFQQGIENGIYEIEATKDQIKVSYSIGNVAKEFMIPPVITEADFNAICDQMGISEKTIVQQYYKKYDINKPGKKDDVEALKANYPIYETEPIYVLRDNTNETLKRKMEEFFIDAGYTAEQWQADKELSLAESGSDKLVFNVNMYYRLEGKDLVVEIPFSELEYKSDTPIFELTPLPYFGAGGKTDEGFLLVPEGGGACIRFNNGKTNQQDYVANLYGRDIALRKDAVIHDTRIYYNTFGISQGDDSFLCILEDGVSYASVHADISGKLHSYNYVNAVYSVMQREQYDVSSLAASAMYVFLPELPDETLVQRYHFVDSGSYVDMAKEYQTYLMNRFGAYFAKADDTEAPVVIEIMSAVDKVKQVLGVPTSKPLKLTTFKEAKDMMTELHSEGLNNMSVKLTGWANGGVKQKVLKSVKLVSDCGSKKDLNSLSEAASSLGVDLYLDGVTQYAYDSDLLDGFFSFRDAARFISKERAEIYQYSAVTFAAREGADTYYLLHADLADKMASNLVKAAQKYKANVSYRELGKELSADYYRKNTTSREDAREQHAARLAETVSGGNKVMINMGNDYAMGYSDMITNMDLRGTEYTIIDEFVPFYQLAIHGYKNYTGEALNLADDPAEELLLSAEYGAGLYFNLMKESPFVLQKTLYSEYFGSSYDAWHERIVETYSRYNRELGHIFNQEMTDHKTIEDDLTCTVYADGTKVYVNYSYVDKNADGRKIPARDYVVVR